MAVRVYIVPEAFVARDGFASVRVPAYMPSGVLWQASDFGRDEPVFLVAADVTAGQHTTIAANSPITVVPADLSNTVGVNLASTQAALDSWNIPGQWVTSGMTWRQVCKGVLLVFEFARRYHGMHRLRIFGGGVTLDTTVSQLTQQQRDRLAAVSDSFHWNRADVTGATTMRQLLRGAAQQWEGSLTLLNEVF